MKKSKILMLLPAFLLVGCAKSLTAEEAAVKMQQIKEKRAAEPLTEWKMESSIKLTVAGTVTEDEKSVIEYSTANTYFHLSYGGGEMWGYKKDNSYYCVMKEGESSKGYYQFAGEDADTFESYIHSSKLRAEAQFNVYAMADVPSILAEVVPVPNVEVKYSTKGDGQLTAEINYTGDLDGMNGTLQAKAVWNDYKPVELSMKSEASSTAGKYEQVASVKFAYSFTPSYPDLTGYTKMN